MASWKFVLADKYGSTLTELPDASGKALTFKRNTAAEARFALSHETNSAALLLESLRNGGIPTLRCYRDGVPRFNGYLAPFTEDAEETSTLAAVFRSPFGRLLGDGSGRGRFTDASVTFTATDAGQIAKQLIDAANDNSFTGLATTGTIEASKNRDRTYVYMNTGEAVINLTAVLDGFDFTESFVEGGTTLAELVIYARQGTAVDARFEYGPGTLANVQKVSRVTQHPVNVARVLGANGLVATARDETSIAQYGESWLQQSQTSISEQATLNDKAYALLRPDPVRTIAFSPDPRLAPSPWDDYWLGDSVGFYARRDAFVEDLTVRVNAVTVVIDDEGNEAFEIPDPLTPGQEATIKSEIQVEAAVT